MSDKEKTSYEKKSFKQLKNEYNKLELEVETVRKTCIDNGKTFDEFIEETHETKEKLFFIDKFMRLKQTPTIEFGKEYKGSLIELEKFHDFCTENSISDINGIGYYATSTSKSDIRVKPSDFLYGLYRSDFTHVLWFDDESLSLEG